MKPCDRCVCGATDFERRQCFMRAALAPFGATTTEDGFIAKGTKATGVRPIVKGKRLRFESADGHLLASGAASATFVAEFVTRFWFWKPVA